MLAFVDTWRWDAGAAERVERLSGAAAHPAQRAIAGLKTMLGPSGMLAYLSYMAERLAGMKRLLKPTGSLYLHCDDTASHYLKILLDVVFGPKNFLNELIWRRYGSHNDATRKYGRIHDVILFYAKNRGGYTWINSTEPHDEEYIRKAYRNEDEKGRYTTSPLHARTLSGGGYEYEWRGIRDVWKFPRSRLDELDARGLIHWPAKGTVPRRKVYLDPSRGVPVRDLLLDVKSLSSASRERLGYPTQKPLALLERIVRASSNEGDVVLDPFCGCGTTVEAASTLGRHWLGIDISPAAIDIIIQQRFEGLAVNTLGIPTDMEGAAKMARENPPDFEKWAITRIPGLAPNERQGGDGGIDGRGALVLEPEGRDSRLVLAQVKGGGFQLGQLRDFLHVLEREQAALGIFITLGTVRSRGAQREAAAMGEIAIGASRYPRAQLWSIADWFAGREPRLPPMNDPWSGRSLSQTRRRLL